MSRTLRLEFRTVEASCSPPCLRPWPELSERAARALLDAIEVAGLDDATSGELDELAQRLERWLDDAGTQSLRSVMAAAPTRTVCCAGETHRAAIAALVAGARR